MENVKTFAMWFIQQLPAFLLAEPISYFVGLGILLCVAGVFERIINIR